MSLYLSGIREVTDFVDKCLYTESKAQYHPNSVCPFSIHRLPFITCNARKTSPEVHLFYDSLLWDGTGSWMFSSRKTKSGLSSITKTTPLTTWRQIEPGSRFNVRTVFSDMGIHMIPMMVVRLSYLQHWHPYIRKTEYLYQDALGYDQTGYWPIFHGFFYFLYQLFQNKLDK